jgi:site-specific recombinase XerD
MFTIRLLDKFITSHPQGTSARSKAKFYSCLRARQWFNQHESFNITKCGTQIMLKRLKAESGITCNAHSFRRGFCVHPIKCGLSTRIVQTLGGWENIAMVEKYSKSLNFDEALSLYRRVNGE